MRSAQNNYSCHWLPSSAKAQNQKLMIDATPAPTLGLDLAGAPDLSQISH